MSTVYSVSMMHHHASEKLHEKERGGKKKSFNHSTSTPNLQEMSIREESEKQEEQASASLKNNLWRDKHVSYLSYWWMSQSNQSNSALFSEHLSVPPHTSLKTLKNLWHQEMHQILLDSLYSSLNLWSNCKCEKDMEESKVILSINKSNIPLWNVGEQKVA